MATNLEADNFIKKDFAIIFLVFITITYEHYFIKWLLLEVAQIVINKLLLVKFSHNA